MAEDYDQLSALGERQARWLGEYFAAQELRFDAVATGTLRRHLQTVEGIFAGDAAGRPDRVLEHPGLDEYDFRGVVAAFENLDGEHPLVREARADPADKRAYYRVLRVALQAWSQGRLPGEDIEPYADFRARVAAAARALQELAGGAARILAVSSGGAISTLLGDCLDLEWPRIVDLNMQTYNTSVSRLFLNRERLLVAGWNGIPHLESAGRRDAITYG